ncbi:MAG: MarC family protein [Anaerolineales bacterium]|jgi:multiple antibiotic resistance protein
MGGLIEVFTILFVTMGPLKVSLVFAEVCKEFDPKQRIKIAVRAVLFAGTIGLLFILAGKILMELFHFSLAALFIAGGLILLVFAIRLILGTGRNKYVDLEDPDFEPTHVSVYPLAVPLIASPMGIVMLTSASAANSDSLNILLLIAAVLLVVMLIDLVILSLVATGLRFIHPQLVNAAERILGLLLAALAVQSIINGLIALGVLESLAH